MIAAGVSRGDIVAATLGLAGVRRLDIRERVRESFATRFRVRKTLVTTDADIALYGTTLGKAGLVVIAGTGSICIGINDEGEQFIAGGWGPVAGDEGGGRGIAGEALHAVAKASDGRGELTKLSERAAEYFRASNVENLIGAIYAPQMDNSRIAGFARLVVETAADGDKIAVDILCRRWPRTRNSRRRCDPKTWPSKKEDPDRLRRQRFQSGRIINCPDDRDYQQGRPKGISDRTANAASPCGSFDGNEEWKWRKIMRYLLSICALFLITATLLAQTPKKAEDWQTFSPVSDEFSVETPMVLEQRGDNESKSSRKFYGSINGVYLYIFSDPVKTPTYFATVRDILTKIGQPTDIFSKEGSSPSTVSFKDSFGYWHNLTTLRTDSRIYIAQTVTLNEKSDIASRFIRSFGLGSGPPLVPPADTAKETKSDGRKEFEWRTRLRTGIGHRFWCWIGYRFWLGGTTSGISCGPGSRSNLGYEY